jgi:MarR family transcriptional regulator, organic hydroperoxide resistance regulator
MLQFNNHTGELTGKKCGQLFAYTNKSFRFVLSMRTTESKYSNCLYFTANALARKIEKLALDTWKKVDLSPSHAYLLMLAIEEPGVQPGTIADHLQLQPSTVTRLIEKLEEKKLVVRTTEGKITNVYPTPKGKQLYPKLRDCAMEFHNKYATLLGKEESTRLVQNIGKFADRLDD